METKKSNKANLENKRSVFLQLGFVIALSLIIFAFEWATPSNNSTFIVEDNATEYIEEIIPITKNEEKKIEPEKPKEVLDIKIFDDDALIDENINMIEADDFKTPVDFISIDDEPEEPDIFVKVEEMPTFKNGGQEKFRSWVISHLSFPPEAVDLGLSGRITAKFIVNENGEVCNTEIIRGVDPLLDNAVLEVLNKSPKWKPGKQRNEPVKVMFSFSIKFDLQ